MAAPNFQIHAERARRGQWGLRDMPWDEPVAFCGSTSRDMAICKINTIDVARALYHFKLGARMRLGDHLVRWWSREPEILECMEWHDADEQRHVQALRRCIERLRESGESVPTDEPPGTARRMWAATYSSRETQSANALLINELVDEAMGRALLLLVARQCHLPLVSAVFEACGQDDLRHLEYVMELAAPRMAALGTGRTALLQAAVVHHVARVVNAFRPHLRSFAGCAHGTTDQVATELFHAASRALSDLHPAWGNASIARLVHTADRSPWLLWLLR